VIGETAGYDIVSGYHREKCVRPCVYIPIGGLHPMVPVCRRSGDWKLQSFAISSNPPCAAFAAAFSGQPDKTVIRLVFKEKHDRIRVRASLQHGARPPTFGARYWSGYLQGSDQSISAAVGN
jgi:hypothetical protein